jgi:hypothetical protein
MGLRKSPGLRGESQARRDDDRNTDA